MRVQRRMTVAAARTEFGFESFATGHQLSPASIDPLLQMRLLRTDRRVQAMTGIDQRVFRQREQTCANAFDDLWKVAYRRFRVTGSARKEGVAAEKMLADQE